MGKDTKKDEKELKRVAEKAEKSEKSGKKEKKDKEKGEKKSGKDKKDKRERLVVLASLDFGEAVPGEVMDALPALVEATQDESGCRKYRVHVPAEGGGRLLFYETWENDAAFRQHLESGHLKAWREAIAHHLKDSVITTWKRLA